MSEQRFLWNSLDGGENVFIKERGSDKIIHIKIIEGKHEFVDFMKKVNGQQAEIERLNQETEVRECLNIMGGWFFSRFIFPHSPYIPPNIHDALIS